MATRILLVSTATRWIGPARMPRALAKAAFEVLLLTPRGSLAEKSRFIAQTVYLPDNATAAKWLSAFVAMVTATSPRLVLPSDDLAFRLLQILVPGRLTYSTVGIGTPPHLAATMLSDAAAVQLLHVPYGSSAPLTRDLLSGEVPLSFGYPTGKEPYLRNGQLKALAITRGHRLPWPPLVRLDVRQPRAR